MASVRRATGFYARARSGARPLRDSEGRITGWFGSSVETDVHRKTVAALRDRERELSQLVDMVPVHLWRLTPDGEPNFFNQRLIDFLGLDVADVDKPGMSRLAAFIGIAVHPDDAVSLGQALNRCFITGERFSMKYRLRRADGVYRWMSGRAEPMRNSSGNIVQWFGLCHDIDDQMQAEEALRRASDRARARQARSRRRILKWGSSVPIAR
jgi:PAS domain S-box-containing protein